MLGCFLSDNYLYLVFICSFDDCEAKVHVARSKLAGKLTKIKNNRNIDGSSIDFKIYMLQINLFVLKGKNQLVITSAHQLNTVSAYRERYFADYMVLLTLSSLSTQSLG